MTIFFRSAKSLWVVFAALAALFLAGTTLTACSSSKESVATAKQVDELQMALKRMEEELFDLRQKIPRETDQKFKDLESLLNNMATAKQVDELQVALKRIEGELDLRQNIPFETDQKLKDLESVLNNPKEWPQDQAAAEKMRQELDEIVQTLSPAAVERNLPQLARLNWGVEALWVLRTHAKASPEQLDEAESTIQELLEREPGGHFPEIRKELETRLKQLEPQVRNFQVKQLVDRANRALEGKEDASAAYSSLEEYRGETEIAAILPKLREKVLGEIGRERIETFERNLTKTRSWGDDRARQVSLLTTQEGLLRLIVDLELEDAAPKEVLDKAKTLLTQCDKELVSLASKQQEHYAEKLRRYQAWALEQIRKFDSPNGWYYDQTLSWIDSELRKFRDATEDEEWIGFQIFPSLKELFQEKLGVDLSGMNGAMLTAEKRKEIYDAAWQRIGWKNSIDKEVAYRTTRDGMVKFLLPIQPHLLDPPVAQLYHQAFSKGWQKLEGREDQLYVAQQSAIVRKKTVEEIAASNP